ncbi:MAG: hypothetical protein EX254_01775 [Flavobacteriaceae bacterium]|nr:MAG: hypothetical protein EX254_01775 [Flavobacteriaceae bacterium]
MKYSVLFLIFFICSAGHAQKRMVKSFSADNIDVINFKFDQIYLIELNSSETQKIQIEAQVEGENSEHIVLTNRKYANGLFISSDYQPAYKDENDKLSAHKVISVFLSIKVPKEKTIYLKSDIANVKARGDFKKLTIELVNGNCDIADFYGNALINTQEGNIDLTADNAKVSAQSESGKVSAEELIEGLNEIELYSRNGDITITKSQE